MDEFEALAQANPGGFPREPFEATLTNYLDITAASGEMHNTLQLLFRAVGFLLLIACANIANLQLAQATGRMREMVNLPLCFMNDLKFAFRQLLKYPGFNAAAVLTLALGIGTSCVAVPQAHSQSIRTGSQGSTVRARQSLRRSLRRSRASKMSKLPPEWTHADIAETQDGH